MKNCLVKKFKGSISGDNPILGEMKIGVSLVNTEASLQLKLKFSILPDETTVIETPNAYPFIKDGLSMNRYEFSSNDGVVELEFTKANYEITVKNKYGLQNLIQGTTATRPSIFSFNIADFAFKSMESLVLPYGNVKGDIGDITIEDKTALLVLTLTGNQDLEGNLKTFFDTLYNTGRTSGTIRFDVSNSSVDTSDMPVVSGMSKTNGTITFSGSGWTQTA